MNRRQQNKMTHKWNGLWTERQCFSVFSDLIPCRTNYLHIYIIFIVFYFCWQAEIRERIVCKMYGCNVSSCGFAYKLMNEFNRRKELTLILLKTRKVFDKCLIVIIVWLSISIFSSRISFVYQIVYIFPYSKWTRYSSWQRIFFHWFFSLDWIALFQCVSSTLNSRMCWNFRFKIPADFIHRHSLSLHHLWCFKLLLQKISYTK